MSKSISVITKKRGRGRPPTTGTGTLIGVRLLDEVLGRLDAWIAGQGEPALSRPEAIRRALDLALPPAKRTKRAADPTSAPESDHGAKAAPP